MAYVKRARLSLLFVEHRERRDRNGDQAQVASSVDRPRNARSLPPTSKRAPAGTGTTAFVLGPAPAALLQATNSVTFLRPLETAGLDKRQRRRRAVNAWRLPMRTARDGDRSGNRAGFRLHPGPEASAAALKGPGDRRRHSHSYKSPPDRGQVGDRLGAGASGRGGGVTPHCWFVRRDDPRCRCGGVAARPDPDSPRQCCI
jgi:hypothetical protein